MKQTNNNNQKKVKYVLVKGKGCLEYAYAKTIKELRILMQHGYRIELHNEVYNSLYYGRSVSIWNNQEMVINTL